MTSDTLTSNDAALASALARAAPNPTRRWLTLLALIVVGGATVALVRSRLQTHEAPVTFVTAPVTRGALTSNITATGTLRARGLVRLGAEASGRVKRVSADFNQPVARDQVLAELDATQAEASLRQAVAQLAAVKADVANRSATAAEANQTLGRTRQLVARAMASAQQFDADTANAARAEASLVAAQAQLQVSEAGVAAARATVDKTRIRSPLDGVVLSRDLEVGQTVNAPSQVFTVAQPLTTLEAVISIDEADVGQVRAGQPVSFTVDAWAGQRFDGVLREVHDDATTKNAVVTYQAVVLVPNADLRLRPGMTVTATVETERREGVVLVPNAALRYRPPEVVAKSAFGPPPDAVAAVLDGKSRVFRLENGAAKEVIVSTGATNGLSTEVREGALAEGDVLVLDAQVRR